MKEPLNSDQHVSSYANTPIDHDLIEYILTLFSNSENTAMDETAYGFIKLMDSMPGGFLIYKAYGLEEIIYANKALLRIFGCSTLNEFKELTHNSFRGIVHPEELDAIEQSIKEQISNSKYDLDYVEYRIIRKDGAIRWVEDYGHFIHSEAVGDIFYVFISDATEKKEHYHSILQEQKRMMEDALNKANLAITAKNTFLSNMSHDMRTPLNAIFGFTALARNFVDKNRDEKNDNIRYYLDRIDASSEQLLDLIDKVLEIAWTEADDIQLTEDECSLWNIMQNVKELVSMQAAEKNITVSLNSAALTHHDVYSDPAKLEQLMLCLVNNAVKYTQHGGNVNITITELESLPNGYAAYQLVVKDNGIGISPDFLERIYEPFAREKNTTFSGVLGTGLGLTIAKNIVKMMGGSIEIDSTVGVGSKFTVTLRLRTLNHSLPENINVEDIISQILDRKILLVEDNEINLEIETAILEGLGFTIDTATDGSIAVEIMKKANPGDYALILMDIQMPVMNGRQATRAIRSMNDKVLSRIPIIALSADAFESDKRKSIESGMDAHLPKPIDVPLLLETIARTIQTHQSLYGDLL